MIRLSDSPLQTARWTGPLLGLLFLGAYAGMAPPGYAQDSAQEVYSLVFRGTPLSQALEALARKTRIDLVYNSDLVAGKVSYCSAREEPAEQLLRCILGDSGLDYVRSSAGTYVLIEALEQPARFGNLAGRIIDAATGEPLPDANILLADASSGTTSDQAGLFSVTDLVSGMHRVVVTYVGYETAVDSIRIIEGGRQRMQIALQPHVLSLDLLVVDGLSQRLPSSRLGMGEAVPGLTADFSSVSTPDVAQGAWGIPGVAAQQPLADLHIQGSGSGEHLTLLDGVPVRDPVSLGRHLSAFSPLAIDRLTVHKAGFGAEHGSHLSGVISVVQDVAGNAPRSAALSLDPVSLNGRIQQRLTLPNGRTGAAMVAVRTNLWDMYRDPGVEDLLRHWNASDPLLTSIWIREPVSTHSLRVLAHQADVSFSDLHTAVDVPLSPFRSLYASAYRARNHIASSLTTLNTDDPTDPDRLLLTVDNYDWTNWAGQVRLHGLIGSRAVGTLQVKGSGHTSRYHYQSLQDATAPQAPEEAVRSAAAELRTALDTAPGSDERNHISEATLIAGLGYSFAPGYHIEAAVEATHINSRFRLGNHFVAPFLHDASVWQWAGFVRGSLSLGLSTTLEPGLRLTMLPVRQTLYAEPRLSLRYDRAKSPIGPYALRLAAGLYRQFVNQFELASSGSTSVVPAVLFWLPTDASLVPPRVYHLAAEVLLMPRPGWSIDVGSYYKRQHRMLTFDYAGMLAEHPSARPQPEPTWMPQAEFISPTRGRAYGADIRLLHTGRRLTGTVTYGFSRSERAYPGRFDGKLEPVPWNAPHRLALDVTIPLQGGVSVNVSWRGTWGRRWSFRQAYYDYLVLLASPVSFSPFDLTQPGEHDLPPFYRLDTGLTFEREVKGLKLQARLFILNVLDRHNIYDWSVEQTETGAAPIARTLPGRHPAFTLRLGR